MTLASLARAHDLNTETVANKMGARVEQVAAFERGEREEPLSFMQRYAEVVGVRLVLAVDTDDDAPDAL